MMAETILDACRKSNVKVSYEYDHQWAEWHVTLSRGQVVHSYIYKQIDIETSGLGTYEYLRQKVTAAIDMHYTVHF